MLLIDTHVLLWTFSDSLRLPPEVRRLMLISDLCVSIVSLWEISIKAALPKQEKRLRLDRSILDIAETCAKQDIDILPITPEDCEQAMRLPHIHADPFYRMIVAQAMTRGLALVTKDENIWKYDGIEKIW